MSISTAALGMNPFNPIDNLNPLNEFDLSHKYGFGIDMTPNDDQVNRCERKPDTRTKEEREKEEREIDERVKWAAIGFGITMAVVAIVMAIAVGIRDGWFKRKKGGGDDSDGTAGTGGGSPPPVTRVPPESSGVASRIAEVRQSSIIIDRFETPNEAQSSTIAPAGFFRTAVAGIRNFFSPQIQMPSPVLVPVNVMPLGTFNPLLTVF